jgi:hypothetical protein
MVTLEDILIETGKLELIYKGKSSLHLWRGLNFADERGNPLYPDIKQRVLPSGDIRDPDVEREWRNGTWYVKAEIGKGTSLVDKEGIFGYKNWKYIFIPAGTVIPNELIITKDHFMKRKGCWHYSISPNYDMPVKRYLNALDRFAMNAGIKLNFRNKCYANNR